MLHAIETFMFGCAIGSILVIIIHPIVVQRREDRRALEAKRARRIVAQSAIAEHIRKKSAP